MDDKIIEFISNIDCQKFDEFISNSSINSSIVLDTELYNYDSSWLTSVEEYLPFINNIVYTDYLNSDNKIVLKSYENKFIKTLIYRLYDFLLNEKKKVNNINISSDYRNIKSNFKTIVSDEQIDIDINIRSKKINNEYNSESYGLTLSERIDRALNITISLLNSEFIHKLDDLSIIQEDVVKSEVFDQELNYRKAYELFLLINDCITSDDKLDMKDIKNNLNSKMLITSYLEYQLLNECLKDYNNPNIYKEFLEKIIEKIVSESTMDEKSFKKMVTKKFENEYSKKKNREKYIQSVFLKTQDNYNKQIKDAIRALKN